MHVLLKKVISLVTHACYNRFALKGLERFLQHHKLKTIFILARLRGGGASNTTSFQKHVKKIAIKLLLSIVYNPLSNIGHY